MIKIIGVGIGEIGSISLEALDALPLSTNLILQTVEIPLAAQLTERGLSFSSLDGFYEEAEDFDEFNESAARFVLSENDPTLCVMGSVAESTLARKIMELAEEEVSVIPGQSFGEYARSVAGTFIASSKPAAFYTADQFNDIEYLTVHGPVIISEVDHPMKASDIALKLMEVYPPEQKVLRVRGKEKEVIALEDLPRREDFDYAVSLVLDEPDFMEKAGYDFQDFVNIIKRLRAPGGCPWDREQTHASIRNSLLEESYEVIDAIDKEDIYAMEDELGDVLLQVVFHAQVGKEHSEFDIMGITDGACRKMIRRHPHVFGSVNVENSEQVLANWEVIKRGEKSLGSVADAMDEIPKSMSPLIRAKKVQKKAAHVGFDWEKAEDAMEKIAEETQEVRENIQNGEDPEEECGDLLFAVVNVLRLLHVDGDIALNRATEKFASRFRRLEETVTGEGRKMEDLTLSELDEIWNRVKSENVNKV